MAGSLTQWGESLLLNYSIGRAENNLVNTPSGGLYIGLATDQTVNESGTQAAFSEISYGGYVRIPLLVNQWTAVNLTGSSASVTYQQAVQFPNYTGTSLITVRYLVLFTQPVGGSPVWYSRLEYNGVFGRILETGDVLEIPGNSIVLSVD